MLSYLHLLGLLDLLPTLHADLRIPTAVADELAAGRALGYDLPDPQALPWLTVVDVDEPATAVAARSGLDRGEAAALTLALTSHAALILIDERAGRDAAIALGLALSGTLGVLLTARREGHIDALAPLLDRLAVLGFRLHPAVHNEVLREAGEGPEA